VPTLKVLDCCRINSCLAGYLLKWIPQTAISRISNIPHGDIKQSLHWRSNPELADYYFDNNNNIKHDRVVQAKAVRETPSIKKRL